MFSNATHPMAATSGSSTRGSKYAIGGRQAILYALHFISNCLHKTSTPFQGWIVECKYTKNILIIKKNSFFYINVPSISTPHPYPTRKVSDTAYLILFLYCLHIVRILFLYPQYRNNIRTICKQYKNNIRYAVSDTSRVGFCPLVERGRKDASQMLVPAHSPSSSGAGGLLKAPRDFSCR